MDALIHDQEVVETEDATGAAAAAAGAVMKMVALSLTMLRSELDRYARVGRADSVESNPCSSPFPERPPW